MANFTAGDTVRMKSDGPTMTIASVEDVEGETWYWCEWFDDKKQHQQRKFRESVLEAFESTW